MHLTQRERFRMLARMDGNLEREDDDRDSYWTRTKLQVLLEQYQLTMPDPEQWERLRETFMRGASLASDDALVGLYATICNLPDDDAQNLATIPDDAGLWNDGQLRLFMSHSAKHKRFVADVSRELAVVGVQGFVAHEAMMTEEDWQPQIEVACKTAQAFVGFVHPEFNSSAWCQQEIGWARARGLPEYYFMMGAIPQGFPAKTQWPNGLGRSADEIAHEIVAWLERRTDFQNAIVDELMKGLESAGDYYSAEAAAKRIVALNNLTPQTWNRLAETYWSNDQVYGSVLVGKVLRPFYEANDREFRPPKPEPDDPGSSGQTAEPPF